MARIKRSVTSRARRKATLSRAKGYYGNKSRSYRAANEQLLHSGQYAYRDRRARKGEFRRLWIQRINAAARLNGTTYSRLVNDLDGAGITVDRKILADIAVTDPAAFTALVQRVSVASVAGNASNSVADNASDSAGDNVTNSAGDNASDSAADTNAKLEVSD